MIIFFIFVIEIQMIKRWLNWTKYEFVIKCWKSWAIKIYRGLFTIKDINKYEAWIDQGESTLRSRTTIAIPSSAITKAENILQKGTDFGRFSLHHYHSRHDRCLTYQQQRSPYSQRCSSEYKNSFAFQWAHSHLTR